MIIQCIPQFHHLQVSLIWGPHDSQKGIPTEQIKQKLFFHLSMVL